MLILSEHPACFQIDPAPVKVHVHDEMKFVDTHTSCLGAMGALRSFHF